MKACFTILPTKIVAIARRARAVDRLPGGPTWLCRDVVNAVVPEVVRTVLSVI